MDATRQHRPCWFSPRDLPILYSSSKRGVSRKFRKCHQAPDSYLSTFFAIDLPRKRFKIGVPHVDFYSSCKETYNKRVTDKVKALRIILGTRGHDYQENYRFKRSNSSSRSTASLTPKPKPVPVVPKACPEFDRRVQSLRSVQGLIPKPRSNCSKRSTRSVGSDCSGDFHVSGIPETSK